MVLPIAGHTGDPPVPAQIKITKRTVDRITGDGSDRFYWDDDLPGFGLRVRASGRKYYVVQFRANGRLRRMTLGRHGAVTPETARRRAMALISPRPRAVRIRPPSGTRAARRQR